MCFEWVFARIFRILQYLSKIIITFFLTKYELNMSNKFFCYGVFFFFAICCVVYEN